MTVSTWTNYGKPVIFLYIYLYFYRNYNLKKYCIFILVNGWAEFQNLLHNTLNSISCIRKFNECNLCKRIGSIIFTTHNSVVQVYNL